MGKSMDRIDAMAALLDVVKAGSFSAAARRLGVAPTSLTRKITELEARLGVRLLNRTTRSLTLTDAGTAYVVAARRIVDDVAETERIVTGEYAEPRGELVITAPTMFGQLHVVPIVAQFLASFPQVDVRLLLTDAIVHLVDERVDLAVRLGALGDSSLVARRVGTMRTVVCASPGYLAAHGEPERAEDVATMPTVAVGRSMDQRPAWRLRDPASAGVTSLPITPRLLVTTNEAAVAAAMLGVGLTQQRLYQVADGLAAGALRLCLRDLEAPVEPVHIVQIARNYLPLKARKFIEFAYPLLQKRLATLERSA
jgi:DNA-binding transcriptional LysR family regulator